MIRLFAAHDAQGAVRFVGDVPRGAACGGFCPECTSPLIAKQGDEVQWHFAHEAGQERPECVAGAANLLRRLAAEYLTGLDQLVFEPYRTSVSVRPGALFPGLIPVQWSAHPLRSLNWQLDVPATQPIAQLEMADGGQATLRVAIDDASPRSAAAPLDPQIGRGVFLVAMPDAQSLRSRPGVMEHLAATGRLIWEYLPDTQGRVANARRQAEEAANQQRAAAAHRWGAIRQQMTKDRAPDDEADDEPASSYPTIPSDIAGDDSPRLVAPAWAPDRKHGTPYHFRKLTDGTKWVLYTSEASGQLLAPYPEAFEGWDEYFPARMAEPLPGTDVLRVLSFDALLMFFRDRAEVVRITSDATEFENL